ncbi:MAG TPA: hypothetical protein ENJ54_04330 [Chloroflexi bacterium]|nr:hypothetical protein [Chloroflexota bacterium]
MIRWYPTVEGARLGEVTVSTAQIVYELHAAGRGLITLAGLNVPPSAVALVEGIDDNGKIVHRLFVKSVRGEGSEVEQEATFTVVDEMGRIADARAWPEPTGNWASQAEDVFVGQASSAILHYLTANVGGGALPARRYGYEWLALPADPLVGDAVEARARFDNLLDLLSDIAQVGGVVMSFDGEFVVREPTARSIELSEELGTVSKLPWSFAVPEATGLVAGGAGEGTNRLLVQVQNSALVQAYGWREDFVNDNRFSSEESLRQRAYAALAARGGGWAADAVTLNENVPGLRWRADWYIGDTFPVSLPDGVHEMMVKGIIAKYDRNGGRVLNLSLVESMNLHSPAWMGNGLALDKRVRLLETK